jgi:sec-independent protein translocase protein TatA
MEWIIILVVALLIFGRRLSEVARSFGRSINEFKRGMKEVEDEVKKEDPNLPPAKAEGQKE